MDVGILQRQVSPLPPGRYWILLSGQIVIDDFGEWVRDMQGAAHVDHVEENRERAELFAIFTVPPGRQPFWPAEKFGFPEIATPEVQSQQDVIKPDAPTPMERILQTTPDSILDRLAIDLPSLTRGLATAALVVLLVYLLAKSSQSSQRRAA